jgi:hypothetical protein
VGIPKNKTDVNVKITKHMEISKKAKNQPFFHPQEFQRRITLTLNRAAI